MDFPEANTQAPERIAPNAVQRNYCSSIEGGLNDCAGACSLLCKAILAVKDGLVNFENRSFCERFNLSYVWGYEQPSDWLRTSHNIGAP